MLDELAAAPAPTALVLSYRDDAASLGNLRVVLGDLPSTHLVRIALPRLSRAAVEGLTASSARLNGGACVYAVTSGNPFFVTEVLRQGGARLGVPATVRDAVLGRAAQLAPRPQQVLQLAAILPRQIDLALVAAVLAPDLWTDAWLAALAQSGDADRVTFDRGFRSFPKLKLVLLGAP